MATATNGFPLTTDPASGDGAYYDDGAATGADAGASGKSTGGVELSQGALIAIIVVVVVVAILGISMSILFYVAKKREWKIRETIRRSARKVVTALTPRRSEFPRSVKEEPSGRRSRGHMRMDDVPPTPRIRPEDLEKGLGKAQMKAISEKKARKWPRK